MPTVLCPACQQSVDKDDLYEHLSECQGIMKLNKKKNNNRPPPQQDDDDSEPEVDFSESDDDDAQFVGDNSTDDDSSDDKDWSPCPICGEYQYDNEYDEHYEKCSKRNGKKNDALTSAQKPTVDDVDTYRCVCDNNIDLAFGVRDPPANVDCDNCRNPIVGTDPHWYCTDPDCGCDFCCSCAAIRCPEGKHVLICDAGASNFQCAVCLKHPDGASDCHECDLCDFYVCNGCYNKSMSEAQAKKLTVNPSKLASCPKGHPLKREVSKFRFQCDGCTAIKPVGAVTFGDRQCDFDYCEDCAYKSGRQALKAASTATSSPATSSSSQQQRPTTTAASTASTTTTTTTTAAPVVSGPIHDAKGHVLKKETVNSRWGCDGCKKIFNPGHDAYSCRACDFDFCLPCASNQAKVESRPTSAATHTTTTPSTTTVAATKPTPTPTPATKPAATTTPAVAAAAATTPSVSLNSGGMGEHKPSVSFIGGNNNETTHTSDFASGANSNASGIFGADLHTMQSQAFDPTGTVEYEDVAHSIEARFLMRQREAERQFCTDLVPDEDKIDFNSANCGVWASKAFIGHFGDPFIGNTELEGGPPSGSIMLLADCLSAFTKLPEDEKKIWFPREVFANITPSKLMQDFEYVAEVLRSSFTHHRGVPQVKVAPGPDCIESATWGHSKQYGLKDCTKEARALVKNGKLSIPKYRYSSHFGDVCPYAKKFTIEFNDGRKKMEFKNEEECEIKLGEGFTPGSTEYDEQQYRLIGEHLSGKIQALKKGEIFFFPCGWQNGPKKSHAVTMIMHCTSDKEIDCILCNTGAGLQYHSFATAYPKGKAMCAMSLGAMPKTDYNAAFFYAFTRCNSVNDNIHGADYFYDHMLPVFFSGATPSSWLPPEVSQPRTCQYAGTCYHKCITTTVKVLLSFRGLNYRQIKSAFFGTRLMMLRMALNDLKSGDGKPITVSDEKIIRIACHQVMRKAEKGRTQSSEKQWVYDAQLDIATKLSESVISVIPDVLVDAPRVRQPKIREISQSDTVDETDIAHPFMDTILVDKKTADAVNMEEITGGPATQQRLKTLSNIKAFSSVNDCIAILDELVSAFSNEALSQTSGSSRMVRYIGFSAYVNIFCNVFGLPTYDPTGFWKKSLLTGSSNSTRLSLIEQIEKTAAGFTKLWTGLPDAAPLVSARFIVHALFVAQIDALLRMDDMHVHKTLKNFNSFNPLEAANLMTRQVHDPNLLAIYDGINAQFRQNHSDSNKTIYENFFTKAKIANKENLQYSAMDEKTVEVLFFQQLIQNLEAFIPPDSHERSLQPIQKLLAFLRNHCYKFKHDWGTAEREAILQWSRCYCLARIATSDNRKKIAPCLKDCSVYFIQYGGQDGGVIYLDHPLGLLQREAAPDPALATFRRSLFNPAHEKESAFRPKKPLVEGLPPEFDVTVKQLFSAPYVGVPLLFDELARRGSWKMSFPLEKHIDTFLFEPRVWGKTARPTEAPLDDAASSRVPTTHLHYVLLKAPGAIFVPLSKIIRLALQEDTAHSMEKSFFHCVRLAAFVLGFFRGKSNPKAEASGNEVEGLKDTESLMFTDKKNSLLARIDAFLKRAQTTKDDPNLRAIALCHRAILLAASNRASWVDKASASISAITALNSFCNDEGVVEQLALDVCTSFAAETSAIAQQMSSSAADANKMLNNAVTDLMGTTCNEKWTINKEKKSWQSENWNVQIEMGLIASNNDEAPSYLPPLVSQSPECRAVFGDAVIRCQVADVKKHCKTYRVLQEDPSVEVKVRQWYCVTLDQKRWTALNVINAAKKNVTVGSTSYNCERGVKIKEGKLADYFFDNRKEQTAGMLPKQYQSLGPAFASEWGNLQSNDARWKTLALDTLCVYHPEKKLSDEQPFERFLIAVGEKGTDMSSPWTAKKEVAMAFAEIQIAMVGNTPVLMWFSITLNSGHLTRFLTGISHHDLSLATRSVPDSETDAVASSFQAARPYSTWGEYDLDCMNYSSVQILVTLEKHGNLELELLSKMATEPAIPEPLLDENCAWHSTNANEVFFIKKGAIPSNLLISKCHLKLAPCTKRSAFFGTITQQVVGSPVTGAASSSSRILASPFSSSANANKTLTNLIICLLRLNGLSQVMPWMTVSSQGLKVCDAEIEIPRLRLRFVAAKSMTADGSETLRFGPVQNPGWFISDFCTNELLQLVHGFPHGVLLETDAKNLSLLLPSASMVRPEVKSSPLSTKTIADHLSVYAAPNRVYRIDIHNATMQFFPDSLEVALYLIHCKLLARDYQEAALLAEGATCESSLDKRERRVLSLVVSGIMNIQANQDGGAGTIFSASDPKLDSHPNALAVLLRVFIAIGGSNFAVGPCSLLPVGKIYGRYISVLGHVSSNLRLSMDDEIAYFGEEEMKKPDSPYTKWMEMRRSGSTFSVAPLEVKVASPVGCGMKLFMNLFEADILGEWGCFSKMPKRMRFNGDVKKNPPVIEHLLKDKIDGNTFDLGAVGMLRLLSGSTFVDAGGKQWPESERLPLLRYICAHRHAALVRSERGKTDEETYLLQLLSILSFFANSRERTGALKADDSWVDLYAKHSNAIDTNTYWGDGKWNDSPVKVLFASCKDAVVSVHSRCVKDSHHKLGSRSFKFQHVPWFIFRLRTTSKRPSDLSAELRPVEPVRFGKTGQTPRGARRSSVVRESESETNVRVHMSKDTCDLLTGRPLQHIVHMLTKSSQKSIDRLGAPEPGESLAPAAIADPAIAEQKNRPGGDSFYHRMAEAADLTKNGKPKAPPHLLERLLLSKTSDKETIIKALKQLWKFLFKSLTQDEREARMAKIWAVEHAAYVSEKKGTGLESKQRDVLRVLHNIDQQNCPNFLAISRLLLSSKYHEDLSNGNMFLAHDTRTTKDIAKVTLASMLRASRAAQIRQCLNSISTALNMINDVNTHERDWIAMIQGLVGTLNATRLYTSRENAGDAPSINPKLLLFEYLFDVILWGRQLDLVSDLTANAKNNESYVKQLLMGAGKSSVVAPLLSLNLSDFLTKKGEGGVVVLTVPPALTAQTIDVVGRRFCIMSGSPVLRVMCRRYGNAESAYRKIEIARKCRGLVICEPDDIKGIQLRLAESFLNKIDGVLADPSKKKKNSGPSEFPTALPPSVKDSGHDAGPLRYFSEHTTTNHAKYGATYDIYVQNPDTENAFTVMFYVRHGGGILKKVYRRAQRLPRGDTDECFNFTIEPRQVIKLGFLYWESGRGQWPNMRASVMSPTKSPVGYFAWGYGMNGTHKIKLGCYTNGPRVCDVWATSENPNPVRVSIEPSRDDPPEMTVDPAEGCSWLDETTIGGLVPGNTDTHICRFICTSDKIPDHFVPSFRGMRYKAGAEDTDEDEDEEKKDDKDAGGDDDEDKAAASNNAPQSRISAVATSGDIDFDAAAAFDKAVDPDAIAEDADPLSVRMHPGVLQALQKGILIVDEADLCLNPMRSELNFPVGDKSLIELGANRWNFCMAFLRRALIGLDQKYQDLSVNRIPHLHIVSLDWFEKSFKPWLASAAAEALSEIRQQTVGDGNTKLTSSQLQSLTAFLGDINAAEPPKIQPSSTATAPSMIVLAKLWVHRLADHLLCKIHNVAYGFPSDERQSLDPERIVAVPYVAQAVPSSTSEFAHPDIAAGFTYLTFRHKGMRGLDMRLLVSTLREKLNVERGPIHKRRTSILFDTLCRVNGTQIPPGKYDDVPQLADIDPFNKKQLADIAEQFGRVHTLVEYYLGEIVYPRILKFSERKLFASAQDLANKIIFPCAVGFTGTTDDCNPRALNITHASGDLAKILSTISDEKIVNVSALDGANTHPVDIVKDIVSTGKFDAIIDCGGLITGLQNEEVAVLVLKSLPKTSSKQACVFLDNRNNQAFLSRAMVEENEPAQPVCECNFPLSQRFVFFDQAHCTGCDVKQGSVAHAALLIGKDDTLRDVAQAVWRMRKLGRSTQHSTFFVPKSVLALMNNLPVLKRLGNSGSDEVDRVKLVTWLALKSLDQSEASTVRRNEQESEAAARRIATLILAAGDSETADMKNGLKVKELTAKLDHSIPEKWAVVKSGDMESTQEQQKQQQQQQQMQMSKHTDSQLKIAKDETWKLSTLSKGISAKEFHPLSKFSIAPIWDAKREHLRSLECSEHLAMSNNFFRLTEKESADPPYLLTPLAILHFTNTSSDPGDVALVTLKEAEAIFLSCTEKCAPTKTLALWSTQGSLLVDSSGADSSNIKSPASLIATRFFRCETSFSPEETEVLKKLLKVSPADEDRQSDLGEILTAMFPRRRLPAVKLSETSFNKVLVRDAEDDDDENEGGDGDDDGDGEMDDFNNTRNEARSVSKPAAPTSATAAAASSSASKNDDGDSVFSTIPDGSIIELTPHHNTQMRVDIQWGGTAPGTKLHAWGTNRTKPQRFKLRKIGNDAALICTHAPTQAIEEGGGINKPVKINTFSQTNRGQLWKFEKVGSSGLYTIVSAKTAAVLTVKASGGQGAEIGAAAAKPDAKNQQYTVTKIQ